MASGFSRKAEVVEFESHAVDRVEKLPSPTSVGTWSCENVKTSFFFDLFGLKAVLDKKLYLAIIWPIVMPYYLLKGLGLNDHERGTPEVEEIISFCAEVFDAFTSSFTALVEVSELGYGSPAINEEESPNFNHNFYKGRVDNVLTLPYGEAVNVRCTSEDVIHGFRVPGLGLKIDCIPGRINTNTIKEESSGVFFGQCHVLCGVHHSVIPIRVDIISPTDFNRIIFTLTEEDRFEEEAITKLT